VSQETANTVIHYCLTGYLLSAFALFGTSTGSMMQYFWIGTLSLSVCVYIAAVIIGVKDRAP
jgi:hypothetical protein